VIGRTWGKLTVAAVGIVGDVAAVAGGVGAAAGAAGGVGKVGLPEGSFSIVDWKGYPAGVPKPSGPFRLLGGAEYAAARDAANRANAAMHRVDPSLRGQHIHEVHPVKFGGSPIDPANKLALPPATHWPTTAWWNQLQRDVLGSGE